MLLEPRLTGTVVYGRRNRVPFPEVAERFAHQCELLDPFPFNRSKQERIKSQAVRLDNPVAIGGEEDRDDLTLLG